MNPNTLKKKTLKKASLLSIMLLSAGMAMANITAIATGAWETASNWSSGTVPISTDNVVIPAGITITVTTAGGDMCASLTIAATGTFIINNNDNFSIGGNLTNAGTFTANTGSFLTFFGFSNDVVSGGGTYFIAGTIGMNMGSTNTALDVQDANFIAGINAGGKYYFSLQQGTFKMNCAGNLANFYSSGSSNSLTIPYGVVIESDNGTMYLCNNAATGKAILSGKLFLNGGTVAVQTGQALNSGRDFQYKVNGGTPQLYVASGALLIGAGFNALAATDYIDFHMTGGAIILAYNGYSKWITFQLADVVGGKTFMSGGTIILQDACNANIEDLDMGGANVAATQYSVTGGTVQLGYYNTQAGSSYFGIDAQPTTNYPNIIFAAGVAKNVSAFKTGNINMLSLYVNSNMTFDATGFPVVNIMSNNGSYAFDDEGGFIESTNTVKFSGNTPQYITSSTLASETFYNLNIANTSGNVILNVPANVSKTLSFTSGKLDASNKSVTITSGSNAITGASSTSYIITGNGVASTGLLNIQNIPTNTNTVFPIGTSTYYLPATLNPGANAGNSYAAFVFQGATTNAMANGPAFNAGSLAKIVNAVWNISRTAGSGTASLTLNWASSGTALEGSTFQTFGMGIGISQYTGGKWQLATGTGNVATETANSSFSSFTQFGVGALNTVLPIVISDFNASLENNKTVLLSWKVSDGGGDIIGFVVQRSNDASAWKAIGTVRAFSNPNTFSNYTFTDESPASGVNYYRLMIQSSDGTNTYSVIRPVMLSSIAGITVFPNPANNTIHVSAGTDKSWINIRLINMSGQVLQSATPAATGGSFISMDVNNYPAGVYLLQVMGTDKILQTSTVVIRH
jgi:hypothetical protein